MTGLISSQTPALAQTVDYHPTDAASVIAGSKEYYAQQARAQNANSSGYVAGSATAMNANAGGYAATGWNVNKDQTAAGQLSSITDPNSMLMQQAATAGTQGAAKRGLINSSLGITAAQDSMLRAAVPIAQQDATMHANAAQFTAGAKNTADQFGANANNQASITNAQLQTNTSLSNTAAVNAAKQFGAASDNAAALQNAQAATSVSLANAQAGTQAAAAGALASNNASLQNAQIGSQVNLSNAGAANTASQFGAAATNTASLQGSQQQAAQALAQADAKSRMEISALGADTQKFLGNLTAATSLSTAQLSSATQLSLAQLDSTTRANLQDIVSRNSQLIKTSESASSLTSQYMAAIANIQQNKEMSPKAKNTAFAGQLAIMQSGLDAIGSISGMDLSKYFQSAVVTNDDASKAVDSSSAQNPARPTYNENYYSQFFDSGG